MVRLVNRNTQIPNGLRFYLPQTKWTPRPHSSFQGIVEGLYRHLQGNPQVLKQLGWPLEMHFLEDKVDEYNAALCEKMGWGQYIQKVEAVGGQPSRPFPVRGGLLPSRPPSLFRPLRDVAVGAVSIAEMFGPEGPITDKALAESRAKTCAGCDLNQKGDWTRFFTVPISRALKTALQTLKSQGMETSHDAQLRVCEACSCPCGLKVWARIGHIVSHMPADSRAALAQDCWIRKETA